MTYGRSTSQRRRFKSATMTRATPKMIQPAHPPPLWALLSHRSATTRGTHPLILGHAGGHEEGTIVLCKQLSHHLPRVIQGIIKTSSSKHRHLLRSVVIAIYSVHPYSCQTESSVSLRNIDRILVENGSYHVHYRVEYIMSYNA